MPQYPIGVKQEDYKILEKEAKRSGCSTRELIKDAFQRNIDSLRGGLFSRRRRR
jgi:hypothetical protein